MGGPLLGSHLDRFWSVLGKGRRERFWTVLLIPWGPQSLAVPGIPGVDPKQFGFFATPMGCNLWEAPCGTGDPKRVTCPEQGVQPMGATTG